MIQDLAFNLNPMILIIAFILDIAIGDPRWLPHPVRIIGSAISKMENILRKRTHEKPDILKIKGIVLVITIVLSTFLITWLIVRLLINPSVSFHASRFSLHSATFFVSSFLLIYLTSTTIATRELIGSAMDIIRAIKNRELETARNHLSMIVGRDTQNLSEKGILKATIETLSENLSDGIIAPLFYLAIGGLPLAMAYKAINTIDSMVGYKNERYIDFGWAGARLDDIANFIPARISGILIVASTLLVGIFKSPAQTPSITYSALRTMITDGRKHLSPNSGVPEAAMAGALGVQLGGPSTYNGIEVKKPYIGEEKTEDYLSASKEAINIIKVSSVIGILITSLTLYVRNTL